MYFQPQNQIKTETRIEKKKSEKLAPITNLSSVYLFSLYFEIDVGKIYIYKPKETRKFLTKFKKVQNR